MSETPDLDIPLPDEETPPAESEEEEVKDIPLSVDERYDPIKTSVGQQATGQVDFSIDPESGFTPSLGEGEREFTEMEVDDEELLSSEDYGLDDYTGSTVAQADDVTDVTAPTQPDTVTVDPEDVVKTADDVTDLAGVTGTVSTDAQITEADVIDDRTKTELLADGALSETITEELAREATTQYQLDSIMDSLDGTAEMPAWASANMRRIKSIMNQRGLGSSSMAAAAMVQALMESAIPIADSDANRYATIQLKNLDNRQQTALKNAALISARDANNLSNRMAAAKSNADAFLTMDIQNLKNEQTAAELTYQADTQALFNDQAAENTAINLNAKLENDINKFYDNLKVAVDTSNANRSAAMEQFNTDQENSMTKFDAKIADSRDKFNANMALLIDQSNVLWRRNINTINNQGENAANQANAAAFLGITLAAQNQLWQAYRDEANMAFTAGENEESRALQLVLTSISNQFASDMFDKELEFEDNKATGALLADAINAILEVGVDYVTKKK